MMSPCLLLRSLLLPQDDAHVDTVLDADRGVEVLGNEAGADPRLDRAPTRDELR
jgi:hypothetical protein